MSEECLGSSIRPKAAPKRMRTLLRGPPPSAATSSLAESPAAIRAGASAVVLTPPVARMPVVPLAPPVAETATASPRIAAKKRSRGMIAEVSLSADEDESDLGSDGRLDLHSSRSTSPSRERESILASPVEAVPTRASVTETSCVPESPSCQRESILVRPVKAVLTRASVTERSCVSDSGAECSRICRAATAVDVGKAQGHKEPGAVEASPHAPGADVAEERVALSSRKKIPAKARPARRVAPRVHLVSAAATSQSIGSSSRKPLEQHESIIRKLLNDADEPAPGASFSEDGVPLGTKLADEFTQCFNDLNGVNDVTNAFSAATENFAGQPTLLPVEPVQAEPKASRQLERRVRFRPRPPADPPPEYMPPQNCTTSTLSFMRMGTPPESPPFGQFEDDPDDHEIRKALQRKYRQYRPHLPVSADSSKSYGICSELVIDLCADDDDD